jgi:hypothetical protein
MDQDVITFTRRPNIGHMVDALVVNISVNSAVTGKWRKQKEKSKQKLGKHKAYSLKIGAPCQVFCPPQESGKIAKW